MADMQTPAGEGGRADLLGGGIGANPTKSSSADQRYPNMAGSKDNGAGKDAAQEFQRKLAPRQAEMLDGLRLFGPCTADDIALKLGRPVHSSRPRMSELERKGAVIKLHDRRASAFGSRQHVYRLAGDDERAVFLAQRAVQSAKSGGVE